MELGSDSASSQDHSDHSLPVNGGSSESLLKITNAPSCSGGMSAHVSADRDEILSRNLDEISTQPGIESMDASVIDNPNQNAVEQLELQDEAADDQQARWSSVDNLTSTSVNGSRRTMPSASVQEKLTPASRRRTFFMVRMPKTADSQIRIKIKLAELQLEEATKNRDILRAALQLRRASKMGLLDKLKVVREKERVCKDAVHKKRLEMDPLQNVLFQFKEAEEIFSEEDLDNKIASLQRRIQHESISLKEEKQLIREIKQLESQRSLICANDEDHARLLESYGSKEDVQEQYNILKKELEFLKVDLNEARRECDPIEIELQELNVKIDDFVGQLESAKLSHSKTLAYCKDMKRALFEQNSEFYKNKDDLRKAKELSSFKNFDELVFLCHQQVEDVLMCWNNDASFREVYIRNNERSTLRRLETFDGRALGPDEEPPLLSSDMDIMLETIPETNESASKVSTGKKSVSEIVSTGPGDKVKLQAAKAIQGPSASTALRDEASEFKNSGGKITQNPKTNKSALAVIESSTVTVDDAATQEAKAAELKEKRRQQETVKAQEAAERKQKQAERAQAKAQARALREAERREKEREKKARKKAAALSSKHSEPSEVPLQEMTEAESILEEPSKPSLKASSSKLKRQGVKHTKPNPIPLSKKKSWPIPPHLMWVFIIIIVTGIALGFLLKF